jgi:hypothetical protein
MEDKRIVINSFIADQFYNSEYYRKNPVSLTQLCNSLLEKLISDEIILLNSDHIAAIKTCAASLNKDVSFVVNSLFDKIELEPLVKYEKVKVQIAARKETIKIKPVNNRISNW